MPRFQQVRLVVLHLSCVVLLWSIWKKVNYIDLTADESFNYKIPPPCKSLEVEFYRWNELLAHLQYQCVNVRSWPAKSFGIAVCGDEEVSGTGIKTEMRKFVSLTNNFDELLFEDALFSFHGGEVTGVIVAPASVDRHLKYGRRIKHIPRTLIATTDDLYAGDKYMMLSEFLSVIDDQKNVIDYVKIDCTTCWQPLSQVNLVSELIRTGFFRQVKELHLVIRFLETTDQAVIFYEWYSTLFKLFYNASMALYRAFTSGDCTFPPRRSCLYRLSFVNFLLTNITSKVLTPVSGLGTF
ncbi:unnamed protein product [Soboliphyme baturini]|uniref:Methyltransf_21 domain-containing protein n=1 Tax=Soboliphyme baturini TaxID=241478 RepID=A0A183J6P7_9BILA|nr:unnamed protein product [Soboliphyme baturini]